MQETRRFYEKYTTPLLEAEIVSRTQELAEIERLLKIIHANHAQLVLKKSEYEEMISLEREYLDCLKRKAEVNLRLRNLQDRLREIKNNEENKA